jgi:predicted DNA-binding protein with PD1-like motif
LAKLYSLEAGDRVPESIVAVASRERIRTGLVVGIGRVKEVRLSYFNQQTKRYEEHDYEEEMEVASLLGDISLKDKKPFLHVHGTFGRRDMSVIGGHVVSAVVSPLLEFAITPTRNKAVRAFDESLGLNVIRSL